MATINGLDKMSYAELLKLQERIDAAIAEKRVEDAAATKEQLRAMAEKAGFSLNDLFGKRGQEGQRPSQISQPERYLADMDGPRTQAELAGGCGEEGREDRGVRHLMTEEPDQRNEHDDLLVVLRKVQKPSPDAATIASAKATTCHLTVMIRNGTATEGCNRGNPHNLADHPYKLNRETVERQQLQERLGGRYAGRRHLGAHIPRSEGNGRHAAL